MNAADLQTKLKKSKTKNPKPKTKTHVSAHNYETRLNR